MVTIAQRVPSTMDEIMKRCPRCEQTKTFDNFHKDKSQRDGMCTYCKECLKNDTRVRNRLLKSKFGITIEQFNEMFKQQEGNCAICGKHQSEEYRAFNVDHNHETGQVRGLLCNNCNTGLGRFEDSIKFLRGAIKYLENYNG